MPKLTHAYSDPSSFTEGQTPYGTYDADSTFQTDIVSVTKWVAKRLGFPVLQLEIPSGSIYACFEESISEYSQHINNYNIYMKMKIVTSLWSLNLLNKLI